MTDEMRTSILAYINMVAVVAPLLSREALQKFVREEQKRIEAEKKQKGPSTNADQDDY